ncbi:MAG TPA: STAS domain-containing protein [Kouleothrix sp.]|uniref:STAS domain-containing protein n=1 Tax=Kouleothrix sp. TaxID=2779161 RepID=UPI002CD8B46A|nr:STAS domain-containing protein [Kouleothrix sp.]HRC76174.1 STAS domain-containing protein [Kouleothrix sp.]
MRQHVDRLLAITHPDADLRRRGRNVVAIALGLLLLDLLLLGLWLLQRELPSLVAGTVALGLFVLVIGLARRSHVVLAAVLLAGTMLVATFAVMLANRGLSDTPFFLIVPVAIAGAVFVRREVWLVFGVCLAGLALVAAIVHQASPLSYLDVQILQDAVALLALLALVSVLTAGSTAQALSDAQRARQQAEQMASTLERMNAQLETRVAERTAELAESLAAQSAQAAQLQASLDRQQALNDMVNALSLPIIPVRRDVLVAPLIGNLDGPRAQRLIDEVLGQVERSHARTIILDITGVAVVDTHLAQVLLRTADAARLLGTQAVLVGIRPEVAQTLVSLGADLNRLRTEATLQDVLARIG